jgi:hypothetical protein
MMGLLELKPAGIRVVSCDPGLTAAQKSVGSWESRSYDTAAISAKAKATDFAIFARPPCGAAAPAAETALMGLLELKPGNPGCLSWLVAPVPVPGPGPGFCFWTFGPFAFAFCLLPTTNKEEQSAKRGGAGAGRQKTGSQGGGGGGGTSPQPRQTPRATSWFGSFVGGKVAHGFWLGGWGGGGQGQAPRPAQPPMVSRLFPVPSSERRQEAAPLQLPCFAVPLFCV